MFVLSCVLWILSPEMDAQPVTIRDRAGLVQNDVNDWQDSGGWLVDATERVLAKGILEIKLVNGDVIVHAEQNFEIDPRAQWSIVTFPQVAMQQEETWRVVVVDRFSGADFDQYLYGPSGAVHATHDAVDDAPFIGHALTGQFLSIQNWNVAIE